MNWSSRSIATAQILPGLGNAATDGRPKAITEKPVRHRQTGIRNLKIHIAGLIRL
jgi:hypothetical protein